MCSIDNDRLADEITALASHIHAAMCRWLELVAEFDRRGGWGEWGARSCAHWISWRCGISPPAAREHVRVARRLADLPLIRAAFARGRLSYSQVRALTRIENVVKEEALLSLARHATAAQLVQIVRAHRGVVARAQVAAGGGVERYVTWEHADDGALLLRARLPAEEGAIVLAALQAGVDTLAVPASAQAPRLERASAEAPAPRDASAEAPALEPAVADAPVPQDSSADAPAFEPASADAPMIESESASAEAPALDLASRDASADAPADASAQAPVFEPACAEAPTVGERRADALVLMADTLLAGEPDGRGGDRYQVVVHLDPAVLRDRDGEAELTDGAPVAAETARRLACDAAIVPLLERAGRPLSVGRKTRSVPPALRRALQSRDRGCRFPGCTNHRTVDAHHITHWANGGTTGLDNLVQLCRHHHRLLHEGGYSVTKTGAGFVFRRPDGRRLAPHPRKPSGCPNTLREANDRHAGGPIDPEATVTLSTGERMDLALNVDALLDFAPPPPEALGI